MSNMNGFYDRFDDDEPKRKKKKKTVYSSKDFIPGIGGIFAKLAISIIYYMLAATSICLILAIASMIDGWIFVSVLGFVIMLLSWGASTALKDKKNIIKLAPVFFVLAIAFIFSPLKFYITIPILGIYLTVTIAALNRLRLPEKIGLTSSLIIATWFAFCVFHIVLNFATIDEEILEVIKPFYTYLGVGWIIVSFFILNVLNVSKTSSGYKTSKSIVKGNVILTLIFSGLVLLISNIDALKETISNAIRRILLFLLSGSSETETVTETATEQSDSMDLSALAEDTGTSVFWEYMEKLLIAVFVVIIAYLLFILVKRLAKKFSVIFANLMDYFKAKDSTTSLNSYQDKEESVFDKTQLNDAIKKRFKKIADIFRKKEKYKDMHDNREKIRYLYKSYLMKKTETSKYKSYTARETILDSDDKIEAEEFASGYEKARYSAHEVLDDEVNAGLAFLGNKNGKNNRGYN